MEAWTLTVRERAADRAARRAALLAILALSHAARRCCAGGWPKCCGAAGPEEQARASLRQEIHRLLEALEPVGGQILAISRDHLSLRPGVGVGRRRGGAEGLGAKRPAALSLLDGELLEDIDGVDPSFDAWLAGERERLRDRARGIAEYAAHREDRPGRHHPRRPAAARHRPHP
jgi:DNA-binding SARP family transcriptional activator